MADTAKRADDDDVLVQYVVMRRDLLDQMKWPVGSIIAQGAHACIAAISEDLHGKYVKEYLAGAMDNTMRKVVLEVKDEDRLLAIGCKLKQANISHRVWVERPENISTCLACRPYPRSLIKPLFKGLRLFK